MNNTKMIDRTENEIMKSWIGNRNDPLVSICTITYNQEKFIKDTLNSILMQSTNFSFEIIIDDDFSQDKTKEIIQDYQIKFPNIIKANFKKANIGMMKNFLENIKRAKGEYIALCEGDDYWIDSLKLQKQVSFLAENSDVSIVHTEFDWLDMKSASVTKNYYKTQNIMFTEKYSLHEYFRNTFIRTLTVCFVRKHLAGIETVINKKWTVGDVPLFLYLARDKKIGYINESMGVYRRSLESASASQNIDKQYDFWKGVAPIRSFFYDYYKLKDLKLKKYLDNEYYDGLYSWSIQSQKYPFEFKSLLYKLLNLRLTINDMQMLIVKTLKELKLHNSYLKLKKKFRK